MLFLASSLLYQNALKEDDDTQVSKKTEPGKKRKNNKKNQSRKRANAQPEKGVCVGISKDRSNIGLPG